LTKSHCFVPSSMSHHMFALAEPTQEFIAEGN